MCGVKMMKRDACMLMFQATFESGDSKDAQRDHSGSGAGDADVPPGSGDAEALDDGDDQGDEITLFDASAVKAAAQSTPTAVSSSAAAKKTGGAAVEHRDSDSSRSADSTGSGRYVVIYVLISVRLSLTCSSLRCSVFAQRWLIRNGPGSRGAACTGTAAQATWLSSKIQ